MGFRRPGCFADRFLARILSVNEHAIAEPVFMASARMALDALATGVFRPVVASTHVLAEAAAAFAGASSDGRSLLIL